MPNKRNRMFERFGYILPKKAPVSADKLIAELFAKFQLLAHNAELGRIRNEFFLNLRSFPVKKYIIFYIPNETGIEIFRIIHSSRNIAGIFDEFFNELQSLENQ